MAVITVMTNEGEVIAELEKLTPSDYDKPEASARFLSDILTLLEIACTLEDGKGEVQ